jgi:FkbM family methyltransferase
MALGSASKSSGVGIGVLAINTLATFPPLGRCLLTTVLRHRGQSSWNRHWVVQALKSRLTVRRRVTVVPIEPGLTIEVDWSTTIGREIYFHGSYEPDLAHLFEALIKPGMTVVDAGANVGELTLRAAQLVGPKGKVISIEPSPDVHSRLARNITRNGLQDRVIAVAAAASSSNGQADFFLGSEPDSLSSSLNAPADFRGERRPIETIRLDSVTSNHGLSQVDLIKIDVEGAEFDVLDGARKLLSSAVPPYVIFEYNPAVAERTDYAIGDVMGLLSEYGYTFAVIRHGGALEPYSAEQHRSLLPSGGTAKIDILATPQQRIR